MSLGEHVQEGLTIAYSSMDSMQSFPTLLLTYGLVYYLSIEAAYAMLHPTSSPFNRSLEDICRQAAVMVITSTHFNEVITTSMATGYGIALLGQLLLSAPRLGPSLSYTSPVKSPKRKRFAS